MLIKFIKSFIKNLAIIYLICSVLYIIFSISKYTDMFNKYPITVDTEHHQEVVSIPAGRTYVEEYETRFYAGMLSMAVYHKYVLYFSIIIAGFITGIKLAKESSMTKYIIIFILGNIIYNCFIIVFRYIIGDIYGTPTIFDIYLESMSKGFAYYVLLYVGIIIIKKVNDRNKVKELNSMLKKK